VWKVEAVWKLCGRGWKVSQGVWNSLCGSVWKVEKCGKGWKYTWKKGGSVTVPGLTPTLFHTQFHTGTFLTGTFHTLFHLFFCVFT